MHELNLFIPIRKVDVAQRLLYGTIAEETPDKTNEIMDYESAKPMFEAWSADVKKASSGRSAGNLRAMHGSVAAGKLDQIVFDDSAKRIDTVAKVVDDSEWNKVLEGVYTGFSVGGRYRRRWRDPANPALTRYTPEPMEVSLVDNPCIPSATFEIVKADGSVELRKFKDAPTNHELGVMQGWQSRDGSFHLTKGAALKHNAAMSEQESDISRDALEFADPGYQDDKKKRYPIDSEDRIRAAWGHIHHDKNQKPYTADQLARIKAKIVAAWRHKIDPDGPPLANANNDADDMDNSPNNDADDNGDYASAEMTSKILAVSADHDALAKAYVEIGSRIATVDSRMSALAKRIEHLESQPAGGGPVLRAAALISKSQDAAGASVIDTDPVKTFEKHLSTLSTEDRAYALLKFSLGNPLPRAPEPMGKR